MTAGNNGASKPEDDDPFGYLYADGQAAGAQPPGQGGYGYPGPAAQPGVPRTSYNQVRTVGERQYGQQVPHQQAYGQQPPQYGQPNGQYAAPETYPGGGPTAQVPRQGGNGGGRSGGPGRGGPNTKALLIAAVAVVAVVLIGIGVALVNGDNGDKKKSEAGTTQGPAGEVKESPKAEKSKEPEAPAELPKQDAATLTLGGSAVTEKTVKGAQGAEGTYISGFNQVGASATWKANMPDSGEYALTVRYAIPAVDAFATLTVNGKANSQPIGLKNFIKSSDPDWEKNWQTTWAPVTLQKGDNEIKISCEDGNQCNVILDWVEVTPPRA
ncbi:CBM35 domain-containing protein [Streptomyces sp. NPDC001787]|uniref:CBM35 domain-containing protein n=1 Tax=Streptomyces sp. NPDC001787 TaxID=3154523 RepID=UPI00331EB5D1